MPTEEKPIPADHPIREIWRLNRLDTACLIELAKTGDVAAAKTLRARYFDLKEREKINKARGVVPIGQQFDEYKQLLEDYINEAVKEFIIKKANHRPSSTYQEKMEHIRIGYRVAVLMEENPKKYLAYMIAAKEFGISESKARHYYKKYMTVK